METRFREPVFLLISDLKCTYRNRRILHQIWMALQRLAHPLGRGIELDMREIRHRQHLYAWKIEIMEEDLKSPKLTCEDWNLEDAWEDQCILEKHCWTLERTPCPAAVEGRLYKRELAHFRSTRRLLDSACRLPRGSGSTGRDNATIKNFQNWQF